MFSFGDESRDSSDSRQLDQDQAEITIIYDDEDDSFLKVVSVPPIENLVFEGGGARGAAYQGAIKALGERGILPKIKRVAGSSAGALTAIIVALGYTADEAQEVMAKVNLKDLVKDQKIWGKIKSLAIKKHVDDGELLLDKIRKVIKTRVLEIFDKFPDNLKLTEIRIKLNIDCITFGDLQAIAEACPEANIKDLTITGTRVANKKASLVCFNEKNTKDMEIALAGRISASIPIFFKPIILKHDRHAKYYDGGCLANFPMDIFNASAFAPQGRLLYQGEQRQNLCTLGLKIDTKKEIEDLLWKSKSSVKTPSLGGVSGLINMIYDIDINEADALWTRSIATNYALRTIQIDDKGAKLTDFDMPKEKKAELIYSGENNVKKWLGIYSDAVMESKKYSNSKSNSKKMCEEMQENELEAFTVFLQAAINDELVSNQIVLQHNNMGKLESAPPQENKAFYQMLLDEAKVILEEKRRYHEFSVTPPEGIYGVFYAAIGPELTRLRELAATAKDTNTKTKREMKVKFLEWMMTLSNAVIIQQESFNILSDERKATLFLSAVLPALAYKVFRSPSKADSYSSILRKMEKENIKQSAVDSPYFNFVFAIKKMVGEKIPVIKEKIRKIEEKIRKINKNKTTEVKNKTTEVLDGELARIMQLDGSLLNSAALVSLAGSEKDRIESLYKESIVENILWSMAELKEINSNYTNLLKQAEKNDEKEKEIETDWEMVENDSGYPSKYGLFQSPLALLLSSPKLSSGAGSSSKAYPGHCNEANFHDSSDEESLPSSSSASHSSSSESPLSSPDTKGKKRLG